MIAPLPIFDKMATVTTGTPKFKIIKKAVPLSLPLKTHKQNKVLRERYKEILLKAFKPINGLLLCITKKLC